MPISNKLDELFRRHAGSIPVSYLRALAYHESGFNPRIVNPKSNATGLFQITSVALADFNREQGTRHELTELTDPDLVTRVAVRHLGNVIKVYGSVASLKPDWTSRRFIELLTLGWNAGHNAVVRLVKSLEAQGIPQERVTVDTVGQLASKLRVPYVSEPARLAWAKAVATSALSPLPGTGNVATAPQGPATLRAAARPLLLAAAVVGTGIVAFNALEGAAGRRVPA